MSKSSLVHTLQGLKKYFEEASQPKMKPCAMVLIDELQECYYKHFDIVGGTDLLKDTLQEMKERNQIIYGERRVYD